MKSLFCFVLLLEVVFAREFTVQNNCDYTVWPGLITDVGEELENGGFELESGSNRTFEVGDFWGCIMWARTNCNEDGKCETGDCGGKIECNGTIGAEPITLADVTIVPEKYVTDVYYVDFLRGFNVPISVGPQKPTTDCLITQCEKNLNEVCPEEAKVVNEEGKTVGCNNSCADEEDPEVCKDTIFKQNCPHTVVSLNDVKDGFHFCDAREKVAFEVVFCP